MSFLGSSKPSLLNLTKCWAYWRKAHTCIPEAKTKFLKWTSSSSSSSSCLFCLPRTYSFTGSLESEHRRDREREREREKGRKELPAHFIHVRICKLFCMTAEHCELKQLVPPVSIREPTAMRYNCDDTTAVELGQTYGHFKAECQPFLSTSVIWFSGTWKTVRNY